MTKLRSMKMLSLAACLLIATASYAQTEQAKKPLLSPPATADVTLNGQQITINYSAPSLRGRKMVGGKDPYGKPWRTGANAATTLITPVNLKIGTLDVPAGTYTIFTLPNPDQWLLIISKKTGEWGIPYPEGNDLGRTPMTSKTVAEPQEKMSISFENTKGNTTELHVRWDKDDEYVTITAQ